MITGIGQTTGEICKAYAEDLGCDLMEITAHAGARPSHAAWQGQIVSLSGKRGYLSLSDIGYGTGDGFKGWNCRHDWYPYFEGSTRMYTAKELEELDARNVKFPDGSMHSRYEAEQYQRAYERRIRESKRILSGLDEGIKNAESDSVKAEMQREFDKQAVILKRREAKMKDFLDKTGMLSDNARTQTLGFGRSTAQRARGSANRHFKNWSSGYNIKNIKTLAEYYKIKYNDIERYTLLKGCVRAVDNGDISPLVGFDLYESKAKEITEKIVNVPNKGQFEIESFTTHFIDRVIGQTSTSHEGMRLGATVEQVIDTLNNPIKVTTPKIVNMKDRLDERINIIGKSCSVIYSKTENKLIQATSFGEGIL